MQRITIFLVLVMVIGFQTNAQERQRHGRNDQQMTAEQIATLGSKKMTLGLDLSASQQKQVYTLLEAQAKDRSAMRAEHQKMREENTKPSDEDKYNYRVAQLDKQIVFKAEMKKILNEEQYKKWSEMMAKKKQRMNKKGTQERRKYHRNRN